MFKRTIQKHIEEWMYKGKIIVLYGARQVGKTTLAKSILDDHAAKDPNFLKSDTGYDASDSPYKYLNCEYFTVKNRLETTNEEMLKNYLGNAKLVVLDEAHRIENVGLTLKIIADTYPEIQIIATGSSSFDLSSKISEPMTGRAIQFMLYPLSLQEIHTKFDLFKIDARLENLLRFGNYPEVFDNPERMARDLLENITSNYLYKDILEFDNVKNSKIIFNLLQLLALQIGNEVSYQELGKNLNLSRATIIKYIDLLEKCFVIFSLNAFSRNQRKEIAKSVKVYFYDLGIRNALIQNFNPLELRNDTGFLWENFCIAERLKYNNNNRRYVNSYFWRTYDQKEIDFIEEHSGLLEGYEFKWGKDSKTTKAGNTFVEIYENSTIQRIDRLNYYNFLLNKSGEE